MKLAVRNIGLLSLVSLLGPGLNAATITVGKTGAAYTTIQDGINAAIAGDTVTVAAGVYNEKVNLNKGITLTGASGAIIDGTGLTPSGDDQLVAVSAGSSTLQGFEIRNFATSKSGVTPAGIRIAANISHVTVQNNKVHDITTSEGGTSHAERTNYNAHGICLYGDSGAANTDINILGNEVYNCKLGQSESVVVNGNVNGFVIANNYIHNTDNIGIDVIGWEGHGDSTNDFATNGKVYQNTVSIDDTNNYAYKSPGGADGIYVDGGTYILIERNKVDKCPIGIETASEHSGHSTDHITIRDNFISNSFDPNISVGGQSSSSGQASNIVIVNNTTVSGAGSEINFQYHATNVIIKNNIFYGPGGITQSGSSNTGVVIDSNIYGNGGSAPSAPATDAHPKLVDPKLDATYHLLAGSPAIDAGLALGNDASGNANLSGPLSGTLDIDSQARIQGSAVDIGADEFSSTTTYTLTASAGTGGTISPSGAVSVNQGASQTFTITAASGYTIAAVTVDGASVGAVASYTFSNVQAAHSISASFAAATTYTLTASAGAGGTITPSGAVSVKQGASQTFAIAALSGYTISAVTVDGASVGAVSSYTFSNVQAAHTINASFAGGTTYTLTASAGTGGTITPSGAISVKQGASQTFAIAASSGYTISAVTVDGASAGAVSSYTFSNVTAAHTISASFTAIAGPAGYTWCAGENGSFTLPGTCDVAYGANGTYAYLYGKTGTITFNNTTFGDPIPGVVKAGYYKTSTTQFTLTASAGTGGSISPSGSVKVNAGASQSFTITPSAGYVINVVTVDGASVGTVINYTFSNVQAAHTISATFSALPVGPTGYTWCASENGSVTLLGTCDVAYGANGSFNYLYGKTGTIMFNNATFGDPIPGVVKAGYYKTSTPQFTLTASAGANGAISPAGSVQVNQGASQAFTITPSSGYVVNVVSVDGASVGAVTSYTFSNVTAAHSISATFKLAAVTQYTLTASAGAGGSISPSGAVTVNSGASQTFTIAASAGYTIASVTVDGSNQGAITSYTFSNVTAGHTITAAFVQSGAAAWAVGVHYLNGALVTYGGQTWKNTYEHTSQADWYPGAPGIWFWVAQ